MSETIESRNIRDYKAELKNLKAKRILLNGYKRIQKSLAVE